LTATAFPTLSAVEAALANVLAERGTERTFERLARQREDERAAAALRREIEREARAAWEAAEQRMLVDLLAWRQRVVALERREKELQSELARRPSA
jgi:hypothetical protein